MKTKEKPRMYHTLNDLKEPTRAEVITLLGVSLGTVLDLYTQVKQAHWNVKGPHFMPYHELFDGIATKLIDYVDLLAERITALGGVARGTAREAVKASLLPEYPLEISDGTDHINAVAVRLAAFGKHVREMVDRTAALGDIGTADIYTEISRESDKQLWFIESHIQ